MKKSLFLTFSLLILVVLPSLAQPKYGTQWYIGAGGNFNATWIIRQNTYGEPELKYQFTPSYAGNLNLGFDFSEHWGFKMELGYAKMGQKYKDTQYELPVERTVKLNYFLLPIMVKYRVGGEKAKFYVMAGPQLGVLLSATQVYLRNGTDAPIYNNPIVGPIDVSKKEIKDRYTSMAGFARMDIGVEITPTKHFMIDIGITSAFSITDLNAPGWRMIDHDGTYQISHDFYAGLNLGFNYRF